LLIIHQKREFFRKILRFVAVYILVSNQQVIHVWSAFACCSCFNSIYACIKANVNT